MCMQVFTPKPKKKRGRERDTRIQNFCSIKRKKIEKTASFDWERKTLVNQYDHFVGDNETGTIVLYNTEHIE